MLAHKFAKKNKIWILVFATNLHVPTPNIENVITCGDMPLRLVVNQLNSEVSTHLDLSFASPKYLV